MEDLLNLIIELGKIRKVPQLVYFSGIHGHGAIKLKETIVAFKRSIPNGQEINEIDFILNSPGGSPNDSYRILGHYVKTFKLSML